MAALAVTMMTVKLLLAAHLSAKGFVALALLAWAIFLTVETISSLQFFLVVNLGNKKDLEVGVGMVGTLSLAVLAEVVVMQMVIKLVLVELASWAGTVVRVMPGLLMEKMARFLVVAVVQQKTQPQAMAATVSAG